MLMLFSKICRLRSLKLKMLINPKSTNTTQITEIMGSGPKSAKSWPVINKNTALKIAKNIQTVCIRCSIYGDSAYKNSNNFLHN